MEDPMRSNLFLTLLALLSLGLLSGPAVKAATAPSAQQDLDNPLEPLAAQKPRTEDEEDRLNALALFATARTLEQRHDLQPALRRYQRALRYDPQSLPALRELVTLAFSLNRPDEGLIYAAKFAEQNPIDPDLLRYSAAYLAESGDWKGAIKLYEQVEQSLPNKKPSPEQVLLHIDLGRLYFLTERYADAAAAFEHVMEALDNPKQFGLDAAMRKELLGDGGTTYDLMGNVFLEAHKPDQARQAFEQFDKIKPDPSALAFNLARVELAAGRTQQAATELQKYFDSKATSKGIAPYELLAKILKEQKQDDQLLSRLEALRKNQPEIVPLAYFLGQQYRQAGKLDQTRKLLESAMDLKVNPQAYHALVDLYCQTNQPEPLLKLLARMIDKAGALPDDDLKKITGNEKLLMAVLDLAQKQHSKATADDAYPLETCALLGIEAKRWNDAKDLVNLAIKADPKLTADLLTELGLGLTIDEKYAQAAAVFQRGIDDKNSADDNAPLYFYLSGALEMQNKTDDALDAAKKAAAARPKDPRFAGRPAWIMYHAKRYDDAARAYQTVIDQFDSDYSSPDVRDSLREARTVLSNIAEQQHNVPQAVEWLEQILDERPDDVGANNDLGFLWADENQHLRRAYRMIQLAVADSPDNAAYRDSLGWVLYRLNRYSEALAELQKAAAGDSPDGEILNHLGDTYEKLGQASEAKAAWTRALEAFKKSAESDKMDKIKDLEKKLAKNE
jgi:tetratricopeptide (TPR) repeat protein